jgi:hypothetical protein
MHPKLGRREYKLEKDPILNLEAAELGQIEP